MVLPRTKLRSAKATREAANANHVLMVFRGYVGERIYQHVSSAVSELDVEIVR